MLIGIFFNINWTHINITNLEGNTAQQLEDATLNWLKTLKNAMDTWIPKSTYQYIYIYQ